MNPADVVKLNPETLAFLAEEIEDVLRASIAFAQSEEGARAVLRAACVRYLDAWDAAFAGSGKSEVRTRREVAAVPGLGDLTPAVASLLREELQALLLSVVIWRTVHDRWAAGETDAADADAEVLKAVHAYETQWGSLFGEGAGERTEIGEAPAPPSRKAS
jgi:hypothetical protein